MGKNAMNKKNKRNPVLWLLFAVVIPVIVLGTLIVFILILADVNVGAWVKNVPVISSIVKDDDEKKDELVLEKAEKTISNQADEINELNMEIKSLESIVEQLEEDVIKLENKNNSEDSLLEANIEGEGEIDTIKKMAASFRKMKSKQAALIFQDLENDIALQLLQELSNNVRGSILEAMEPKKAAELTQMFVDDE